MNWIKYKKRLAQSFIVVVCCATANGNALDFSNMFKGVITNQSTDVMNKSINSVKDVSFGHLHSSTQGPADAVGKVVLYRTSWSEECKSAAAYMLLKKIPFVERDIETSPTYKTEFIRLGGKGVPFFVFGAQTMSGFSESAIDSNYAEYQRTQTANKMASTNTGRPSDSPAQQSNTSSSLMQSGDTLVGKIAGIKVYTESSRTSKNLLVTAKAEEMIYMGEEHEGLYRVTTTQGEGWVDKLLVKKK